MKGSTANKPHPHINKLLKKDCFFQNYDKIQQALKIVKPIKHKCIEEKNSLDIDDEVNDKNKAVEELDYLLDRYNRKEKNNMTKYKNLSVTNNIFLSSYKLLRSKSTDSLKSKQQFDYLINKYSQNQYKLPVDIIQRSAFHPTPLVMTKYHDLKIYYRVKVNRRNKKVKSASYLENIADFLNYVSDLKENRPNSHYASYLNDYSNSVMKDERKKEIRERNKCQKEISQSKRDIHTIKETIITLEKMPNNNDVIDMALTKRSDAGSWRGNILSPGTTGASFFNKTKKEGLLLTGNRRSEQPFNKFPNLSRQNSTLIQRNSIANVNVKKRGLSTAKASVNVGKLKVNEMYNLTKGSSLFNNSDIAKDLKKYFDENNKHINLEKKRMKSSQLVDLISSTKALVQSVDIRKMMRKSSLTKSKEAIEKNISFVDKIDQTISKIDEDMFKCALADKKNRSYSNK